MAKCVVKKHWNYLTPVGEDSENVVRRLKFGQEYQVDITQPRNLKKTQRFFKLLNEAVLPNLPDELIKKYPTVTKLRSEIAVLTGHYDEHVSITGKTYRIPHSLSFKSMDDHAFNEFFDKAIDVIIQYFLPGNSKEEILRVLDFT